MTTGLSPGGALAPVVSDRVRLFVQVLAVMTVLLIASRQFIAIGITLGHLACLVTAPLWVPSFRRYRGGVLLAVLVVVASVASVWLTAAASFDHVVTTNNLVANTLLIAGSGAAIGVLFWARELLPVWLIGAVYGFGMLISALTRTEAFAVNPWKFALAVPMAFMLLALASRTGRRGIEVGALLALAAISVAMDSRSFFAEFVIAAILVGWQAVARLSSKRGSTARVLLVATGIMVLVYQLGTTLLVGGALGSDAQARSIEQVDRAGSILVGGRPEMGATVAMFLDRPMGYGAGTLANRDDIAVAKNGMAQISYDPDNGYVDNFLFGSKIELHSMAGGLWAYAGFAGIALTLAVTVLLIVIIGRGLAERAVSGLVLFAVIQSLWNLLFNPLYSSVPILVLALGLGLHAAQREPEADPVAPYWGNRAQSPNDTPRIR